MAPLSLRLLFSLFLSTTLTAYAEEAALIDPPDSDRCSYLLVFLPTDTSPRTQWSLIDSGEHYNDHIFRPFLDVFPIELPAPPDLSRDPLPTPTVLEDSTSTGTPNTTLSETPYQTETETETETETITQISTSTATATTTQTRTISEEPSTVTISLSVPPETVTDTVVVTVLPFPLPPSTSVPSSSSSTPFFSPSQAKSTSPGRSSPTSAPSSRLPAPSAKEVWVMPTNLKDLGPFKVTSFPGSGKNLNIISGIPPKASITPNQRIVPAKAAVDIDDDKNRSRNSKYQTLAPLTMWAPATTSLQLFYPAGSINPAQKPKGGEEFYASPIDVGQARNVSLRYSVYFPSDFDWVLAGKLPGLYGGHTGCSGGNAALDCFSTRLMWRSGGAGELYLYASKDRQTDALCSDPRSECNAAYGFSIGRGSFTWAAGAWTTVVQTVVLNTPGKQDGAFSLDVNGKRVIDKHGVFYRDVLWPSKGRTTTKAKPKPTTSARWISSTATVTNSIVQPTATTTKHVADPLGDILGPLLSEITRLLRRDGPTATTILPSVSNTVSITGDAAATDAGSRSNANPTATHHTSRHPSPLPHRDMHGSREEEDCDHASESCNDPDDEDEPEEDGDSGSFGIMGAPPQRQGSSIGFIGIFFSTFFGGHDAKYATPKDQYVWFKDFALSYND